MANSKWYLLCNENQGVAKDLIQLPEVWRGVTGVADLDDQALATIGERVDNPDLSLLPIDVARAKGISAESIDMAITMAVPSMRDWIRTMRDPILAITDAVTMSDRWITYDVVGQSDIAKYRQALRDITQQNVLDVKWPAIPPELDFLRDFNIAQVARPSDGFIDMLRTPTPPKTIAQIKQDQWLRIHAERERRKNGGLKYELNGKTYWFWTDEPSRTQYSLLADRVRRANLGPEVVLENWKTMSGEFIPFTVEMLHYVIDTGIVNEGKIFTIAQNHRLAMEASDDPANYNFRTGWPESYFDALPPSSNGAMNAPVSSLDP